MIVFRPPVLFAERMRPFSRVQNTFQPAPLYFEGSANKKNRNVSEADLEKFRAQQRLAEQRWAAMPVAFQLFSPVLGQKVSQKRVDALKENLQNGVTLESNPAVQAAMDNVFSGNPESPDLVANEKAFLERLNILLRMAENKNQHLERSVLRCLAGLKNAELRLAVIEMLAGSSIEHGRAAAAKALPLVGSEKLRIRLLKTLAVDPDYKVRNGAAGAIAGLKHAEDKLPLIRLFEKEADYRVKTGLAKAISTLPEEQRVALLDEFAKSKSWEAREITAQSLEFYPEGKRRDELVTQMAKDPHVNTRYFGTQALGLLSDEKLRDELIAKNFKYPLWNVRYSASCVFQHISDPELKKTLALKAIKSRSPNSHTRINGITALMSLPESENNLKAEQIRKLVNASDWVASQAAHSISEINDTDLKLTLIRELSNHPNVQVRYSIADAINSLGDDSLRAETTKWIIDNAKNSRYQSFVPLIRQHKNIKNPQIANELVMYYATHANQEIRRDIATGLKGILKDAKHKAIHKPLMQMLRQSDDPVLRYELMKAKPSVFSESEQTAILEELFSREKGWLHNRALGDLLKTKHADLQQKYVRQILEKPFQDSWEHWSELNSLTASLPEIEDASLQRHILAHLQATAPKYSEKAVSQPELLIKDTLLDVAPKLNQPELFIGLLDELLVEDDYNIQRGVISRIKEDVVPEIIQFNHDAHYLELLKSATAVHPALKTIQPAALLPLLQLLSGLNLDSGELGQVFEDYSRLAQHFMKRRAGFPQANQPAMDAREMHRYLRSKSPLLLKGLLLCGRGAMIDKFDQRRERFENFMKMLESVSNQPDLVERLYRINQLPAKSGQSDPFQASKIVELCYGLMVLEQQPHAVELLDRMIDSGQSDLAELNLGFFQKLAEYCDLPADETQALDQASLKAWNLDYINTLPATLNEERTQKKAFKDLVKASLQGNYKNLLSDVSQPYGEANERTRQAFVDRGLNYEEWLDSPTSHEFTALVDGKPHRMEVRLWKREPGYDLFQGNYSQACTAMGSWYAQAIVDALEHTFTQMAEIVDKTTHKTVGKDQLFWAEDQQTGEPILVSDNVQMAAGYIESTEIRDGIAEFTQKLGERVAGRPVESLLGKNLNKMTVEGLPSTGKRSVQAIGDTATHKYFMSSYHGYNWQKIDRPRTLKFYRFDPETADQKNAKTTTPKNG